jgi:hypothetical protein
MSTAAGGWAIHACGNSTHILPSSQYHQCQVNTLIFELCMATFCAREIDFIDAQLNDVEPSLQMGVVE